MKLYDYKLTHSAWSLSRLQQAEECVLYKLTISDYTLATDQASELDRFLREKTWFDYSKLVLLYSLERAFSYVFPMATKFLKHGLNCSMMDCKRSKKFW